jgi:hypothetical protein
MQVFHLRFAQMTLYKVGDHGNDFLGMVGLTQMLLPTVRQQIRTQGEKRQQNYSISENNKGTRRN